MLAWEAQKASAVHICADGVVPALVVSRGTGTQPYDPDDATAAAAWLPL